ncbi:Molybdopterin molybdenumtransferase OS=Tsukamurella paurometabola (strain ATCC 8368 / DSM /CCUG 35730 / CIP 100753 / JCM 10117 / KCTC 9821 / NBRC 16120/ NCIMB 702349 / NCTC 13040) OX=521096 GN=Tpau_3267 PE=3 SV=1 [Tsukamurella paurometabola]|uniref:Molybdopterin molybdenumtransferase n=1 Tax=Tsukamurella paurometabola (strain ATCC 8368 / DSM 20162 / CCUG 35730 / CIP 100753 / JCM 10117 / KCTC 9821 / NBRC 16120 / NCIMB 702349 / NCTC 13040) TaxID=521096 RepID=D5UVS0_TSUPD|nr:gephyrin-like molybdotransferase Glp [Tsukamurella paurometabola]ADG79852.1 molybdenum cofactor synthesis domain protein [Tsukamurella paurometabola DSM 20162]SUP37427.1 Molybdopterin molybdenumtransferase [Tsukamurella paurometabola]
MRSVEDHLARVTAAAVAPRPVRVGISEAQGMMCAEEVVVENALPAFDQAAIDGYAVRSVDVADAGAADDETGEQIIVSLPVVGEVRAGNRQPIRLQPGQAVKVETGAPLPTLADAVLPDKWTDGGLSKVKVGHSVRSGQYVRRTGDDVQPGDVAVRRGTVVGPAQVGLLAAVGRDKVSVHPRPRVAVISVGRELVDIDRETGAGQVYDVASYALAAAARDCGAEVHRVGIVSGDQAQLHDAVEAQLQRSEVVVITSSLGGTASDEITAALADLGDLAVERIAMHPASVQGFGTLGPDEVPTFLLPSNPMSALVAFEVMVRPLVRIALGKRQPMRRLVTAKSAAAFESPAGRRGYVRGQLMRDDESGEFMVAPIPDNGSHLLVSLAEANCLIVVDPEVTEVRAGDDVVVDFLAQRG